MANMAELVYSQFQKEGMENVDWMLYDYMPTTASATQTLKFFQNSSSVGRARTNMVVAGQLPDPQAFLVTGMECLIFNLDGKPFEGTVGGTDVIYPVNTIFSKGYMDLVVSPKTVFESHMRAFYSQVDAIATASATDTQSGAINNMLFRKSYRFQIPILILPQRHFELNMTVTTPAETGGYTSANSMIMWIMRGLLRRNSN